MKEKTRNYAQKVQQALLNLFDPVLLAAIRIFCLHASRQPAVIKHRESKYAPESWRRLMVEDGQQLRNMIHGFSPEEIYHQIVLLAANAFAIGGKNEQQKRYLLMEQSHGFQEFMKFMVSWLGDLAGREEVGELMLSIPYQQISQKKLINEEEQQKKSENKEKELEAHKIAEEAWQRKYLLNTEDASEPVRSRFHQHCVQESYPFIRVELHDELLATITMDIIPIQQALERQKKWVSAYPGLDFAPTEELRKKLQRLAERYIERANNIRPEVGAAWADKQADTLMLIFTNILQEDIDQIIQKALAIWKSAMAVHKKLLVAKRRELQEQLRPAAVPDPVWLATLKRLRTQSETQCLMPMATKVVLPERLPSLLSKAQIAGFLNLPLKTRVLKSEMVPQLLKQLESDQQAKALFFEVFVQELAVGPGELEELLQCTPTERKRWIKDGKLAVLGYQEFRKAGQDLLYPIHDRRVILGVGEQELARWRSEHQALVSLRRKTGARMAQISKQQKQQARHEHFTRLEDMVSQWDQSGEPQLAATLRLAYWTQWASRWAKENQLKIQRAIKYQERYQEQRDKWYVRKDVAMRLLARTPYARVSFYRPEEPDKYQIELCYDHHEMRKELDYPSKRDFYYDFVEEIESCSHCAVQVEIDYYSLYYLEITASIFPDLRFSFHIPYSLGKAFFPRPQGLPHVEHKEQDGVFRFGRSLLESEKILYREQDVESNFLAALALVESFSG